MNTRRLSEKSQYKPEEMWLGLSLTFLEDGSFKDGRREFLECWLRTQWGLLQHLPTTADIVTRFLDGHGLPLTTTPQADSEEAKGVHLHRTEAHLYRYSAGEGQRCSVVRDALSCQKSS